MLEMLHRGTSLPGMLLLKLNQSILGILSAKYRVILVTGTNGKTTTASLITKILKDSGHSVICNATGANMLSGIVTLFVKHENDQKKEFAVIEIDEANVPLYSAIGDAECIVCTNLFRDQLDRYGEIHTAMEKIKKGIDNLPGIKIILAADEPLFNFDGSNKIYYGFDVAPTDGKEDVSNIEASYCPKCNGIYTYEFYTYNHLGKYKCASCGTSRPTLNYSVRQIIEMGSNYVEFLIDDNIVLKSNSGGLFSIYNIMAAYVTTRELGVGVQSIINSIENFKPQFGRHESIRFFDKQIKLMLVKNPVGFNESIKLSGLDNGEKYNCFMLNDNYADGKDISWIWDVDFENLALEHEEVIVSGSRSVDMAIRLAVAGQDRDKILIESDVHLLIKKLKACPKNRCICVYATYTAMLEFRRDLAREKIIQYSW